MANYKGVIKRVVDIKTSIAMVQFEDGRVKYISTSKVPMELLNKFKEEVSKEKV